MYGVLKDIFGQGGSINITSFSKIKSHNFGTDVMNPVEDHLSLKKRNEVMAKEISNLKAQNRRLKKLLAEMLESELKLQQRTPKMVDKEVQTNPSHSHGLELRLPRSPRTPITIARDLKADITENTRSVVPKTPSSALPTRNHSFDLRIPLTVSRHLGADIDEHMLSVVPKASSFESQSLRFWSQDECALERFLSPDLPIERHVTPPSIERAVTPPLKCRPRRTVPKPASYRDTPLNAKIRKGYQFFKFNAEI